MPGDLRILIIEDEADWAAAIKAGLSAALIDLKIPFTIDAPTSLRECKAKIESAREAPYDLISLDISFREFDNPDKISGLELLSLIEIRQAAWIVSILTGIEDDGTTTDTYGEEKALLLQNELRSRAFKTFPPERLVVMEKPQLGSERLAARLRQVCLILRHSRARQNLFRHLELDCMVRLYETKSGHQIKEGTPEFDLAKRAYDFVKKFEKNSSASSDPKKLAEYKKQQEYDVLARNGSKLKNAVWDHDVVSLRQIRFGCGEVITLPDNPNFETIAWLLAHPGEEFTAAQIGGESPEIGQESVGFEYSTDHDESDAIECAEDDEEIDEDRGSGRDFESDRQRGAGPEVDTTEEDSHQACRQDISKKRAALAGATGSRRDILMKEIKELEGYLATLRRKSVGGKTHASIKQHKSRAIADLKKAGQVKLAEHLERTISVLDFKFSYDVKRGEYVWNT